MKKVFKNTIFLSVCGLLTVVVAWVIAYLTVQNEYALPSPWATATAAVGLLGQGGFYAALFSTLGRAALAFVAAFVLGVGLAVIAYLYPSFEKFLRGIIAVLRALPTMAILLLILVGVSPSFAPVIIGGLTLFPLLYTAAYSALSGVDKDLLEMSRVYRVPTAVQVKKLYLPTALPVLCREGVAALSFSLKLIVSAEVLAFTSQSIGGWMQTANIGYRIAEMTALTAVVCLLGVLIEVLGVWGVKAWEAKRCV
jgi:NitT/TauT family transport system permease protein